MTVFAGRYTAQAADSFVVFLIGMRVNKPFALRRWMTTSLAMPRMLKELHVHPELGFLGGENFFRLFPLTTCLLSYWRTFEDLEQFAHSKDHEHLPAWRTFNKLVGQDGSVGIWHETYQIHPGQYEVIYGNMPRFGLGAAVEHVSVTVQRERARQRLTDTNE